MDVFYPKHKELNKKLLLSAYFFCITTEESNNINNMSFNAIDRRHTEYSK